MKVKKAQATGTMTWVRSNWTILLHRALNSLLTISEQALLLKAQAHTSTHTGNRLKAFRNVCQHSVLDYTDETKQSVEIPYSTLELEKDMDVYAIKFEVTADADIEKFVYGINTGTNDADNGYYFQEEGSYVVLEAGKKQEVMWIVPSSISGTNAVSNLVNPDGNITVGYYYGTPDTVTLSNIEVYYEQPQTTTTTTTTTNTTSKITTTSKPKTTTTAPIEPTVWGDADCDGKVFLNDAVLVMQCIGNPDVYGINGTDPSHITKQGKINADVYENGTKKGL